MFSLIITIISIALVAALALATLYYGGSAFNRGSAGAEAARLINEGQQVNGAVTIAKADAAAGGSTVTTWGGLMTGNYLSQLPSGLKLTDAGTIGTVAVQVSSLVCAEINTRAGHTDSTTVDGTGEQPGVYGCNTFAPVGGFDTGMAGTFYFKM